MHDFQILNVYLNDCVDVCLSFINRDGFLDKKEFRQLLSDLFCDGSQSYKLTEDQEQELLTLLDQDQVSYM